MNSCLIKYHLSYILYNTICVIINFFIRFTFILYSFSIIIDIEDHKHDRILHKVSLDEIPLKQTNNSNFINKNEKADKEGICNQERNEDEVRLLKIKELF